MTAPRSLRYGEALAPLYLKSNRNPRFATASLGGRFVLLAAVDNLDNTRGALSALAAAQYDESTHAALLLCADPRAETDAQIAELAATKVVFFDAAREASAAWGVGEGWVLLDPSLRALAFWPLAQADAALNALRTAPAPAAHAGVPLNAPVLIVPRVFEPAFCKELIAAYARAGGEASGTTRESADGKTYVALDDGFKRRFDYTIAEPALREGAMHRMFWRLNPEIEKAFMQKMTRMERYIVACYDAQSGGYFRPHRDNTTKGTAHRMFAVTINLNAEDYDGGDLRFPEFGDRTYRAPTGGAVVFSCALLHEALPVTRGKRYAFLPFLYNEAAAETRRSNNVHLDDSIGQYAG